MTGKVVGEATGEGGFAYFSSDPKKYAAITASDKTVYLGAYKRGKNAPTGDGSRMATADFDP